MNTMLTPKQSKFVEEYLIDLNASQAAVRAGYSERTARQIASENLSKPDIQNAIAEAMEKRSKRVEIDADWVLQNAVQVYKRCMSEIRPVCNPKTGTQQFDDDGNVLYKFNATGANRALELVGKNISVAAFKERLEISNNGFTLAERIQEGRRRIGRERDEDETA